jgi:hypothetical protein
MNNAKIAALLLISFIATGSVVYQIRNRRPVKGTIVGTVPTPQPQPSSKLSLRAAAGAPSLTKTGGETTEVVRMEQRGPAPNIPANGWGRNPFLTIEEINKLNQPDLPVAVETPLPQPKVEPPALPTYAVTGIISGSQGKWAIVDGRMLRPGEHLDAWTLKEIKDRSVVLERDGLIRELPLKKLEDTAAAAPPKKEGK